MSARPTMRPQVADDALCDVGVAARGLCRAALGDRGAGCCGAVLCLAPRYVHAARGAVAALQAAGRLTPANRQCVEGSDAGRCLACDALDGEPCGQPGRRP